MLFRGFSSNLGHPLCIYYQIFWDVRDLSVFEPSVSTQNAFQQYTRGFPLGNLDIPFDRVHSGHIVDGHWKAIGLMATLLIYEVIQFFITPCNGVSFTDCKSLALVLSQVFYCTPEVQMWTLRWLAQKKKPFWSQYTCSKTGLYWLLPNELYQCTCPWSFPITTGVRATPYPYLILAWLSFNVT